MAAVNTDVTVQLANAFVILGLSCPEMAVTVLVNI